MINSLAIVGLGLLGASIAKAVRQQQPNIRLIGFDEDHSTRVVARHIMDEVVDDLANMGTSSVDMLVLAVPVLENDKALQALAVNMANFLVITDVGSVKQPLVDAVTAIVPHYVDRLVLSHPIAGKERSGIHAVEADLFAEHTVIITPLVASQQIAIDKVVYLWHLLGAHVEFMALDKHDKILSYTSHLPHLLSFGLAHYLSNTPESREVFHYAAGGFRDFTRIAESSPKMWSDIVLSNRSCLLPVLQGYIDELTKLQQQITQQDATAIQRCFGEAKAARQYFKLIYNMKTKNTTMQYLTAHPTNVPLLDSISVPGDKSISHRAIMLGAIAEGTTHISGFLEGEDNLCTLQAFRNMGVNIQHTSGGKIAVQGVGKYGLQKPASALDLGNSGTAMRLISGILVAQNFATKLIGDSSLSKRPMGRILQPLSKMGADISAQNDHPPIRITPAKIHAVEYVSPVVSAQVKSAVLLAGLYAAPDTITRVIESQITRNHTENMLKAFGVDITQQAEQGIDGAITTSLVAPNKLASLRY